MSTLKIQLQEQELIAQGVKDSISIMNFLKGAEPVEQKPFKLLRVSDYLTKPLYPTFNLLDSAP